MESYWHSIGIGVGFLALFGLAVFANGTFAELESEIAQQDRILAACVLDLNTTSKQLKDAVRERDFALAQAASKQRLVESTAGESADKSFQILRHRDTIAALHAELAALRESRAKLEAIAAETKAEPKRYRVKRKKKPAARNPQRAKVHEWFW